MTELAFGRRTAPASDDLVHDDATEIGLRVRRVRRAAAPRAAGPPTRPRRPPRSRSCRRACGQAATRRRGSSRTASSAVGSAMWISAVGSSIRIPSVGSPCTEITCPLDATGTRKGSRVLEADDAERQAAVRARSRTGSRSATKRRSMAAVVCRSTSAPTGTTDVSRPRARARPTALRRRATGQRVQGSKRYSYRRQSANRVPPRERAIAWTRVDASVEERSCRRLAADRRRSPTTATRGQSRGNQYSGARAGSIAQTAGATAGVRTGHVRPELRGSCRPRCSARGPPAVPGQRSTPSRHQC